MTTLNYEDWMAGVLAEHPFRTVSVQGGLVVVKATGELPEARIPLPEPVVELPIPPWINGNRVGNRPPGSNIKRMFLSEARTALLAFAQQAAQLIVDAE